MFWIAAKNVLIVGDAPLGLWKGIHCCYASPILQSVMADLEILKQRAPCLPKQVYGVPSSHYHRDMDVLKSFKKMMVSIAVFR